MKFKGKIKLYKVNKFKRQLKQNKEGLNEAEELF